MMQQYFVEKLPKTNREHEVHAARCTYQTERRNYENLGSFSNCKSALEKAKLRYPTATACFKCMKACVRV